MLEMPGSIPGLATKIYEDNIMKQWEYQILEMPLIEKYEQERWLDKQGDRSWELCTIVYGSSSIYCFFKREVI